MWNKNFLYVLNYLKILRCCSKTIHRRTHRNKIKKACWAAAGYSRMVSETVGKGCFRSITESVPHNWTLHIRIGLDTMFQLKPTTFNFWTKFTQKGCFSTKTEKSEHQHWILHIGISLDTKFLFKLTIFIFWTKFALKRCFQSKAEKVNINIEFCILELV